MDRQNENIPNTTDETAISDQDLDQVSGGHTWPPEPAGGTESDSAPPTPSVSDDKGKGHVSLPYTQGPTNS